MVRQFAVSALALFGALAVSAPASAENLTRFTQAGFEAAQKEGRRILVDVHAPWCPTCAAQAPTLKSIGGSPRNADLVMLRIDFDTQKKEQKLLGVTRQSTIIAFNGYKETGRLVGDTDPKAIVALAESTRVRAVK